MTITAKRIYVTHREQRVTVDFDYGDGLVAAVFYDHITDCLRRGLPFNLEIAAKNPPEEQKS